MDPNTDARELPPRPSLEQYRKQAKDLVKACRAGDSEALRHLREHHPRFEKLSDSEIRSVKFALADAQFSIAREYGFESWPKFAKHIEALTGESSAVSQFESAVDAVVTGDVTALKRLLRENPELIRERSTRVHRATLLHYVGANGVENYRQKSPKNAALVAETLLKAGADIQAEADMYGGGTATFGLVMSSIHPVKAGVLHALIETFVKFGVFGALEDSIAAAAALGRLDLVKAFINEDGSLKAPVRQINVRGIPKEPKGQMEFAFIWACLCGRTSVAGFLLEKGVDPGVQDKYGFTGLHLAAHNGHLDTVRLLLDRKAPLEVATVYGGTVLGHTCWCAVSSMGLPIDYVPIIETLIDAGAKVEPGLLDWWEQQNPSPSTKARIAEVLRRGRGKS